jgi:NAD(P)H-quinone oxidoreductase subunit 4L
MSSKSNILGLAYILLALVLVGLQADGFVQNLLANASWNHVAAEAGSRPTFLLAPDLADVITAFVLAGLAILAIFMGANVAIVASAGTIFSFFVLTVNQEPIIRYMTLSAVLFVIGMYGMVVCRNAVRVLMSIELMLNAVNINLVTFAKYIDPALMRGQLFAIFILTIAAAEAVVGLAIVLAIYRNMATVDMDRFNLLKW